MRQTIRLNATRPLLRCGTALLAVLAAGPALAQADAAIEEVVVTAARTPVPVSALPYSVTLIDKQALDTQVAISGNVIESLSQFVPSFSPGRQKLTGAGETFRGRKPVYLVDGVPQSNPLRDGSREGFTIDPIAIERVEVIAGANALQGLGATGGLINFVTRKPATDGTWTTKAELQVTSDDDFSDDGQGYRMAAVTSGQIGRIDITAAGALETRGLFFDANGRAIAVDDTQGDLMDSKSWNGFLKLGWTIDDERRLQLMGNAFTLKGDQDYVAQAGNRAANLPATSIRGTPQGDAVSNRVRTASLDYTDEAFLGGRLTGQAFYQNFRAIYGGLSDQTFRLAPGQLIFDQSANHSEKIGTKLTQSWTNIAGTGIGITAGLDWLHDKTYQDLVQTGRKWVPETTFNEVAGFVQLDKDLFDKRLHLTGGVRQDHASLDVPTYTTLNFYGPQTVQGGEPSFDKTLFNAGAVVRPLDGVSVYVSFAQGFGLPDVGRVLRGVNIPNQRADDLVDLSPIVTNNLEIGGEYTLDSLTLGAALFRSTAKLGSLLVRQAGSDVYNVQRERTRIRGLELRASYAVTPDWQVGSSLSVMEGRRDSNGDGKVDTDLDGPNIAPDRLNGWVEGTIAQDWTLRLQGAWLMQRDFEGPGIAAANQQANDFQGYALFDAAVGYQGTIAGQNLGAFTLSIQNLLDRQYITYISDTDRATDNLRFFAGRGRTLTLRWTRDF
ncbi:TonB-dependent receptor [Oleisolibacter albus]|uniref:TonB-dependent receptor n=1 Tax=Oleisolibacter albus TaxID=2171757 RepID=UPI000DF23496|nr:TonB-dependent receptor [Oleisolibacter albus]